MRLGVVLSGVGVHGAAGAGVLAELWRRQMEPYAVCGLGTGAWPAALYAAGSSAQGMQEAAEQLERLGRRGLRRGDTAGALLHSKGRALINAAAMQRLLNAQTGGRILALCPRRAIFPLRMGRREQKLVLSTQAYAPHSGAMLTMQASASFAARAAMSVPPFLAPVEWMGAPLLPVFDTHEAARQLFALGAQRVLIVDCVPSPRTEPDALDLAAMAMETRHAEPLPGTARLCIALPEGVHALSVDAVTACVETGKKTAERELDHLLSCMGMAQCRILPFQRG